MTTKDQQQEIITKMRNWQKVENESVASTGQIMQKTDNPVIRLAMEIIQRDSQMHYWVQKWIADSLDYNAISLNPDELAAVWDMIENHIEIEKKMTRAAKETLSSIGEKTMPLQKYFLQYLADDEEKHTKLLGHLEDLKKWLSGHPY